ncbi:MAG: hypothetical protein P8Z40_07935 [Chloroflexota bacterium]
MKQKNGDELGYLLHGRQHPSELGFPELTINITSQPTGQHFDPEHVVFPVVDPLGQIGHLTVFHPWRQGKTYRVCAGRIVLRDRLNKRVEAFSFGGELEVTTEKSHTACLLRSPAPIFELVDLDGLSVTFISTLESLLARQRVTWDCDDAGYEHRLASVKPDALFTAALVGVAAQLDHTPSEGRGEHLHGEAAEIDKAIENMQAVGLWPPVPPTLDDLLACPDREAGSPQP